jgi:exodeoxyribonuclease V alpha subunit
VDILEGIVERITYYSDETGYTVLRIKARRINQSLLDKQGLATVIGTLPEIQPGESVRLTGQWASHKEYGSQFRAESVEQIAPATVEGLKRYLGSGLIKGVGPVTAGRIVEQFGLETLSVLDTTPDRLLETPGVGKHRANLINRAWIEQKQIKEVMIFLQSHRVNTTLAVRIYKMYGDASIANVKENPYRLAQDIYGIGFKTADQIALSLGLPFTSPHRVAAGILHTLSEFSEEGHTYAPRAELIPKAVELLEVQADACEQAIEALRLAEQIVVETLPSSGEGDEIEAIYMLAFWHSERGIAQRLKTMTHSPRSRLAGRIGSIIGANHLSDQQRDAVRTVLSNKVSILTGGPGTGKTTTLKAVIEALDAGAVSYALASPTGRAAKRLSEATGKNATTIHRLLGFKPPNGFIRGEDNPLNVDMLIIDEASMLDLILFYNILKALTLDMHLLLVGDVDQLPSVGAGDVLRDLIRSEQIPVTRLDIIFRQAEGSLIIQNAHQINQGKMPDLSNKGQDFFLFTVEEPEAAADLVVEVVKERIARRFGLDPITDIQVLSPMHRGTVGVGNLNERLQDVLNPANSSGDRLIAGRRYRVGDKVIQMRNNYDKDVFNGDLGQIKRIDPVEQVMQVQFDDRIVDYDFADVPELTLAYAISVHRSQGSEYPAVVVPMLTQHYLMLQRNLLYTAITRAKKLVVLVGSRKAIGIAIHNDKVLRRYTGLAWRLAH